MNSNFKIIFIPEHNDARTFKGPFIATQLNSTQLDVELSCVAINGPLSCVSSVTLLLICHKVIVIEF